MALISKEEVEWELIKGSFMGKSVSVLSIHIYAAQVMILLYC